MTHYYSSPASYTSTMTASTPQYGGGYYASPAPLSGGAGGYWPAQPVSATARVGGSNPAPAARDTAETQAATEPLVGGATIREAYQTGKPTVDKTDKAAEDAAKAAAPGADIDVPVEVMVYKMWRKMESSFLGMALFVLGLFMVIIGALVNILIEGAGLEKWGWAAMWGAGIILVLAGGWCLFFRS